MIFGAVIEKPQKVVIVDPKAPTVPIVVQTIYEDDHGWMLSIEWPDKPKATKVVRL